MEFATHCLKQGQNGKTIYNKLVVICQLLKQHGRTKILNASDWPGFVQTVRPIYEDGEPGEAFQGLYSVRRNSVQVLLDVRFSRRRGPFHNLARRRLPPHGRPRYSEAALGV
jgi:hypothetical protein